MSGNAKSGTDLFLDHQAKGIDLDAVDVLELREGSEVALVVTGFGKHDLPVVAAL